MKVVFASDVHYSLSEISNNPQRKGRYALILLLRLVKRLNRFIKPDLVLFGGDMINAPEDVSLLEDIKKIIDTLNCPYLIIRGNHDSKRDDFAAVFGKMPLSYTSDNIRFLNFDDIELPGYCAARSDEDMQRMKNCRNDGFAGRVVSFQHYPLFPPLSVDCKYPYANAGEIIEAMHKSNINAAICGHEHKGFHIKQQNIDFFTARSFIEDVFPFYEITLDDKNEFTVKTRQLAMPKGLRLSDNHIHTPFAYCNENMDLPKVCELRDLLGLRRSIISEHSAHLLFNEHDYSNKEYFNHGMGFPGLEDRTKEYLAYYQRYADDKCLYSMEIDIDKRGKAVISPEIFNSLKFKNGAVHELSEYDNLEKARDEFLFLCDKITDLDIDALAHPFRVFGRRGLSVPKELYIPLAEMLAAKNVAVEINLHTNDPDVEFINQCLERGVKISLGSDSHNLYEVGEFFGHLELLERCESFSPDCLL